MNYELAKKLKDAGFPKSEGKCPSCMQSPGRACSEDIYPTLSELIEACGDKFYALESPITEGHDWLSKANQVGLQANGSTPEEAVANLWLKIHGEKN